MLKPLRLTRRLPVSLTQDAYRKLRRVAQDSDLSTDELLVFLFENFNSVTDEQTWPHRLRLFKAKLAERKR